MQKSVENNSNNDDSITKTSNKNVSELSVLDIYKLLYSNDNGGIDYHGNSYKQEGIPYLKINMKESKCG